MGPERKPKVVFIDWYNTLSPSLFWEQLKDPTHPRHAAHSIIQSTLFTELGELIAPWMRGTYTTEDVVTQLSKHSGIPYEILLADFIVSVESMQITAGALDTVKQIRARGVLVSIATDNMDSFPRWTVPALSLSDHFDHILDSYTIGALKKDFTPEGDSLFFREFFRTTGIFPQDAILIDDSADTNNKIAGSGVNYRQIEPIVGLQRELDNILLLLEQK